MRLYNSLTKKVEKFTPLFDKKVLMYVCGITPYDTTHLGHAFTYISFDVLVRYLLFKEYKVTYTQNVTDINDRDNDLLKRAKEQKIPWYDLASFWTKRFLDDMEKLNWRMPDNYLKASEQISKMIQIIEQLLKNKFAYKASGNVFFDIKRFPDFGKLSRLKELEMLVIAKEFDEDLDNSLKKHRLDFTLWRASRPTQPKHIPSFDSPFGRGRPGWHIECSAMAISSLDEQIDIHGGGQDLIYPHHEAEIAQSEGGTDKIPFAKYWIHTGAVSYKNAKMSKSLGNLILVSDLLKKYSPNAIRFLLLSHHYRKSWEFTESEIKKVDENINIVEEYIKKSQLKDSRIEDATLPGTGRYLALQKQFAAYMDNDLQTPEVLSYVLKLTQKSSNETQTILTILQTLGFHLQPI